VPEVKMRVLSIKKHRPAFKKGAGAFPSAFSQPDQAEGNNGRAAEGRYNPDDKFSNPKSPAHTVHLVSFSI